MVESFLWDLRSSIRMFLQNPGFIATAALSLALGIGANTTIFSVVNVLMFRPLPFAEPNRLVMLDEVNTKENDERSPKLSTLLQWRQDSRSFEQVEGVTMGADPGTMTGAGVAEKVRLQFVSPSLFSLLGVKPALGRTFRPEEADYDSGSTILLSHALWQRRFGSNPDVIGQSVTVQSRPRTIVGIMPPGFWVFPWNREVDGWLCLNLTNNKLTPDTRWLSVLARLRPGATLPQAQAEMDVFSRQLEQAEPRANSGWRVSVTKLQKWCFEGWQSDLALLSGAVGFVLLIACANVANLLLARAATREREIALRIALGADRPRIVQQLLTESLLLALLGGATGVLLAVWGLRIFAALAEWFPRGNEILIDGTVLGFTLGISLLTGILFGLVPSLQASKSDLNEALKAGRDRHAGHGRHLGRNLMVVSEVALALVLLVGAGLMTSSLLRLKAVNPGFNARNLLTASIDLSDQRYRELLPGDMKKVTPMVDSFYQQVIERLQTVPGVESVGAASALMFPCQFRILGRPEQPAGEQTEAVFAQVNFAYFHTMQIPLLKGRNLARQDDERSPWVVVVNETMARKYFSGEDPIGKLLHLKFADLSGQSVQEDHPRTIVGVVGDVKHWGLRNEPPPAMYAPEGQHNWIYPGGMARQHLYKNLLLRTASEPANMAGTLRQIVAQVDRDQAVFDVMPMEQKLSEWLGYQRFYLQLFGIFSALAVALAVVGLYGVMSYSVARSTHEIGVRVAIGAGRNQVLMLVVRQALKLTLAGVAIGIAGALALTRFIAHLLYGVRAFDPVTFAIVSLLLILVGLLAGCIPARRAAKVDPVVALRCE